MLYFPSNHPIFRQKHSYPGHESCEEREERFARLAALRQELLSLLQGDEPALLYCLQRASDFILSQRDPANDGPS
jgi:hypothetical protein